MVRRANDAGAAATVPPHLTAKAREMRVRALFAAQIRADGIFAKPPERGR
jgi:hypothetical protein